MDRDERNRKARELYTVNPGPRKAGNAKYNCSRKGRETRIAAEYRRKYDGFTIQDKERMFQAQGYRCAGCGTADPGMKNGGWHTHHTGSKGAVKVHGILCWACNVAARQGTPTDIARLRSLADWLESLGDDDGRK